MLSSADAEFLYLLDDTYTLYDSGLSRYAIFYVGEDFLIFKSLLKIENEFLFAFGWLGGMCFIISRKAGASLFKGDGSSRRISLCEEELI